jgi:hypothetical protein
MRTGMALYRLSLCRNPANSYLVIRQPADNLFYNGYWRLAAQFCESGMSEPLEMVKVYIS